MKSDNFNLALDLTEIEAKARQLRAEWLKAFLFGQKSR